MDQLHIEFLNTSRRSEGFGEDRFQKRKKDSGLFWWSVFITILLGMATFSWFFSIYIFAHPEKPLNYRILTHLEKIEPPTSFSALTVPTGKFFDAKGIYTKYYGFGDSHLEVGNSLLKRRYLKNYKEEAPIYVKGVFRISEVRQLTAEDVFPSGYIVRATSREYPTVSIEYIFPCTAESTAETPAPFTVGDDLSLDRTSTFASLLNAAKLHDDSFCFSLVPLVYGTYQVAGSGTLSLSPPKTLNMSGHWPLTGDISSAGSLRPKVAHSQPGL